MEGIEKLQEIIDEGSSIQEELIQLDKASTNEEMLSIAHRIRAKRSVRQDIIFEIRKALSTIRNG